MKETNEERFTKYFCQYSDDLFLYLVRDLGVERETAIDLYGWFSGKNFMISGI